MDASTGMTKSYLGIDRDDMKSEVDAINIQRTDVLNSTNATDVLKSFAAKMPKDFDPKKLLITIVVIETLE